MQKKMAEPPSSRPSSRGPTAASSSRLTAPRRRARIAGIAPVLAIVFVVGLFMAPLASADTSFGEGGVGSGQLEVPNGVVISEREGGDIYVDDSGNQRIDEFTPAGAWVRAFGWGVGDGSPELQTCVAQCQTGEAGEGAGQLQYSHAIAVDNDPGSTSFGDVYVVDQVDFRVEKYGPAGEFLLMFGGGVDHTTGSDVCTAADVTAGDVCGAGEPGTGPAHFYQDGSEPQKSWAFSDNSSIAVGPDGTVYVGDYGRIQEFEPDGSFAREFALPVPAGQQPQFVVSLAIDSAGDLFERSAVYASGLEGQLTIAEQTPGVREFNPAHALVRTFDEAEGSELTQVALDAEGDVFVSDYNEGKDRFREFRPSGLLFANIPDELSFSPNGSGGSPESPFLSTIASEGIVVDGAVGFLFTASSTERRQTGSADWHVAGLSLPESGPASVEAGDLRVDDLEPTTATLHGAIDPHGFATEYHFEYGETESYGESTSGNLEYVDQLDRLQLPLSGLATDTTYHWRLVAESECEPTAHPGHVCITDGPDRTFQTLAAASVQEFTTQTVGPEFVELKALINPNNSPTRYVIKYGANTEYSSGVSEGQLPIGSEFQPIKAKFAGLSPNTEYHYQLVATNGNGPGGSGEFRTADQTFTTEETQSEEDTRSACPNQILREENSSLSLPDCRAYEQVTPAAKNGGEAFPKQDLAPAGERDEFVSSGTFSGAVSDEIATEYIAHRTPGGWRSQPVLARLAPGFEPEPAQFETGFYGPELDRWLFLELPGLSAEHARVYNSSTYFSEGFADGTFLDVASPTLSLVEGEPRTHFDFTHIVGQADDLSKLFIATNSRLLPAPADPRPDEGELGFTFQTRLYELSGVGTPAASLRLAAEVPSGLTAQRQGSCLLDAEELIAPAARMVSANGEEFFYTSPAENSPGASCGEGTPNPVGLFVGTASGAPVQINVPPSAQCSSPAPCSAGEFREPFFEGSSPDGSLAWFTTTQPLINGDHDHTSDLYLAKLSEGRLDELVLASGGDATDPTAGEGAEVVRVDRVSADGTHVAFVAKGILTTTENSAHEKAVAGADNLYIYDATSGSTRFVARLCDGAEESGDVPDAACSPKLTSADKTDSQLVAGGERGHFAPATPEAEFTPDGRFFLFRSWAQLTPDDTDAAADVYRFDFQTGQLERVSFGRDGNDGNGNDDAFPATIGAPLSNAHGSFQLAEDEGRSISDDGSVVVFTTSAPLVSGDTNDASDVYEWEQGGSGTCHRAAGCISLVSDGLDPHGVQGSVAVISDSGRDITFPSFRGLVPADTDGVEDIYDARVEGGFPFEPAPIACGGAETCHGAAGAAELAPSFTSEETRGAGNPAGHLTCAKGRHRVRRHGQVRCVPSRRHGHGHKVKRDKPRHRHRLGPGAARPSSQADVNRGGTR